MSYALYKFHKAILSLHGTELQKKQWLASSYIHHILHLQEEDLPEEVRAEFRSVCQALIKIPGQCLSLTLEQSVRAMTSAEVDRLIQRIVLLHDSISRLEAFHPQ